ncbi:MAG: hypothetical protein CL912_14735 [Deltaproteobacteria bacterium]|nr:hypothetical protein [Deltaproteobacteria bacterium]|tara:strand:+ start:260 stop:562 length:303 start_codon:yes stop_codon:yes gene_type:complete
MIDDNIHFTWYIKLKARSKLSEVFRQLHKYIEKEHKMMIRRYRCDNEFAQGPVGSWCKKHNVVLEVIVSYAYYMNGVVKCNMRIVREKVAFMIQDIIIFG